MDTSDSKIVFDNSGQCDHCNNFYTNILPNWHPDSDSEKEMMDLAEKIKEFGKNKSHDCIIGVSGGIDSSYLVDIAVEKMGLNPLLYHVDGGWNSQQAVSNIESMVDYYNLDLHTDVINWKEMQDLQLAFFKSQVSSIDTPQDHAFFSSLYNFTAKNKFKYVLTGANYSTECFREPLEWTYHTSDLRQTLDIHKKFGKRPLKTFPTADILKFKIYYRFVKGLKVVKPLNYFPYEMKAVIKTLSEKYGWMPYKHKHHESRFTRFFESYWLPKKFGFDKRKTHFSSLVLTGQMTRENALELLQETSYDQETIEDDFEFIATKLGIEVKELREIMKTPNKKYSDYKNKMWILLLGTVILKLLGEEKGNFR
tara:strand:+ start:2642 stop:3742 length:1101 start_codon:yes stop_codon:yes gene_type:complete